MEASAQGSRIALFTAERNAEMRDQPFLFARSLGTKQWVAIRTSKCASRNPKSQDPNPKQDSKAPSAKGRNGLTTHYTQGPDRKSLRRGKAERLDRVSPYQCVLENLTGRATLCGAGLGSRAINPVTAAFRSASYFRLLELQSSVIRPNSPCSSSAIPAVK